VFSKEDAIMRAQ
jgi:ribosomal protein L44E